MAVATDTKVTFWYGCNMARHGEIIRLSTRILEAVEGHTPVPVIKFEKNEVVRVISGPFTEFTGKIEEVNTKKPLHSRQKKRRYKHR